MNITISSPSPLFISACFTALVLSVAHLLFLDNMLGQRIIGRNLRRTEAYSIGIGAIVAGYALWLWLIARPVEGLEALAGLLAIVVAGALPTVGFRLLDSYLRNQEKPTKTQPVSDIDADDENISRIVSLNERLSEQIKEITKQ